MINLYMQRVAESYLFVSCLNSVYDYFCREVLEVPDRYVRYVL
jgi:hypothetical protein